MNYRDFYNKYPDIGDAIYYLMRDCRELVQAEDVNLDSMLAIEAQERRIQALNRLVAVISKRIKIEDE